MLCWASDCPVVSFAQGIFLSAPVDSGQGHNWHALDRYASIKYVIGTLLNKEALWHTRRVVDQARMAATATRSISASGNTVVRRFAEAISYCDNVVLRFGPGSTSCRAEILHCMPAVQGKSSTENRAYTSYRRLRRTQRTRIFNSASCGCIIEILTTWFAGNAVISASGSIPHLNAPLIIQGGMQ